MDKLFATINNFLISSLGVQFVKYKPNYHYVKSIYGRASHKLIDIRDDKSFYLTAKKVFESQKTTLYYDRLYYLYQALMNFTSSKTKVIILEVGSFKGGSVFFLAELAKKLKIKSPIIYSVDTFEGHQTDDIKKGTEGNQKPKMFSETSFSEVKNYLKVFPFVHVIKGRIQDVTNKIKLSHFNLIHIDTDLYEPTIFTLNTYHQKLLPQGIIIIDDYNFITCPGVKKAVNEFIQNNTNFYKFELETGQCLLMRKN